MSQALLIYRGNQSRQMWALSTLASPHSSQGLASTRQEAFILQSITPTCQLPYFTIIFGGEAFTLWSGIAWNWWYSSDCPRSCSNLKDREKKRCDIFSMKTWMLRKTNNAFLAKTSAPNLIHSMDLTAYTAGQVTFLFPSWLLYHAWHMHITATESLQKRRRRGGEQRGAEGSGGEGGEGQAQELMYHSAPAPSTGPMLQCVFCSFHSCCSVTSVEKHALPGSTWVQ